MTDKENKNLNMVNEAINFIASVFENHNLSAMESIDQAIWIL